MPTEERYFFRILVLDTPVQVLIINNLEFLRYLPSDYKQNMCVIEIIQENFVPNRYKVKYYHLLLGFVPNKIFGYIFDGVSSAYVNLAHIGLCTDLLQISAEPLPLIYGPNNEEVNDKILREINSVGSIGVNLIYFQKSYNIIIA